MARHALIDAYVARLADELPVETVDELADGLHETWESHLAAGLTPEQAERAAIVDFGPTERVVDAFVAQASGRRTARLLLATGPVLGACWGASLVVAKAWTWPIPAFGRFAFGATLLVAVLLLVAAATSRHSYRRTRLGFAGALSLSALDAVMILAVAAVAPILVWPMAVAIPASLTRIGFTVQLRPRRILR
jgi:hypothetical protein